MAKINCLLLPILVILSAIIPCRGEECRHHHPRTNYAITYGNIHGRLGDALVAYMRAKWISYKYNLLLLYRPFHYSDELELSTKEAPFHFREHHYKKKEMLCRIEDVQHLHGPSTLFELPYFSENRQEYEDMLWFQKCEWFAVDWEDHCFRELLRKLIAPKKKLELLKIPPDTISVALHVRTGGEFEDEATARGVFPLKFPPLSWYLEQLIEVFAQCKKQKLFVYIFTDDSRPERIFKYFKNSFFTPRIEFACRSRHNRYDANVLEDLFSMAEFDCLIRPMSNFSFVAGIIGKAKLIIFPSSYRREGPFCIIDKTEKIHRGTLCDFCPKGKRTKSR